MTRNRTKNFGDIVGKPSSLWDLVGQLIKLGSYVCRSFRVLLI